MILLGGTRFALEWISPGKTIAVATEAMSEGEQRHSQNRVQAATVSVPVSNVVITVSSPRRGSPRTGRQQQTFAIPDK